MPISASRALRLALASSSLPSRSAYFFSAARTSSDSYHRRRVTRLGNASRNAACSWNEVRRVRFQYSATS